MYKGNEIRRHDRDRSTGEEKVRPKKHLGQHFLHDENIARKIVTAFAEACSSPCVLEVGPGMGVLTKYLVEQFAQGLYVAEVDAESVAYLQQHYPQLAPRIKGDFLAMPLGELGSEVAVIGNFPYNISSQIVFKVIENRQTVPLMVGMFQKEVAERLVAKPSTKAYGILSVITQAYYDVEYMFTVGEGVFRPPPKVKSAVVRLKRKKEGFLNCDESLFLRVVKAAFNQRRKTLRNALSGFGEVKSDAVIAGGFLQKRAEELTVADFVQLTLQLQQAAAETNNKKDVSN